ncbi:Cell division protein FtsL [Acidipropionibacterium virtanenii]|uniref:Cell division protein FtsL n=1 Tax=Acidipropionibacterium virtanenii TaxID=2057246 RepID=A0A344UW12_9ACTN|nr:Cell division protein FtsL [Acidipropionibacterium virtanenii]
MRGKEAPRKATAGRRPSARRTGWPFSRQNRFGLTSRALILAAAVAVVFVMITPSLGVYFNQKAELSRLTDQEAQQKKSIAGLQDELERWNDPNYVRAQARSQLGWVVPGETGYRVIGKDGRVLGGGVSLESSQDAATAGQQDSWWRKMIGSIKTADSPQRVVPSQTPR